MAGCGQSPVHQRIEFSFTLLRTMPAAARDHAWLWGDEPGSSDITLLVYPAGDGPDGGWTAGKPEPVAKLPLHALVLASASPRYFRPRTHGSWKPGPDAAGGGALEEPAAKRPKIEARQPSAKVLELTCFPGEPNTVPEAVICYFYTGRLPDDPSMLAWMMARADYLDMAATVEACLAKLLELSAAGQLSVQDVIVITSLPPLQTEGSRAAVEQAATSMAGKVLSSQLGNTRQVLLDQQRLDQLVQMPFPLFLQWARLESLEVDSENTMAVLITAWYDHQLSSNPAAAITKEQCKELSTLIRLDKVSLPFHLQAMQHLKWYHAPAILQDQHAVARVMTQLLLVTCSKDYSTALASGGTARQQLGPATAEKQWSLSRQQLETLWELRGQTNVVCLMDSVYFAGFCFSIQLMLNQYKRPAATAGDPYDLALYLSPSWPSVLIKHGVADHVPIPFTAVRLSTQVGTAPSVAGTVTASASVRGFNSAAEQSFSGVQELLSFFATQPCVNVTLADAPLKT